MRQINFVEIFQTTKSPKSKHGCFKDVFEIEWINILDSFLDIHCLSCDEYIILLHILLKMTTFIYTIRHKSTISHVAEISNWRTTDLSPLFQRLKFCSLNFVVSTYISVKRLNGVDNAASCRPCWSSLTTIIWPKLFSLFVTNPDKRILCNQINVITANNYSIQRA